MRQLRGTREQARLVGTQTPASGPVPELTRVLASALPLLPSFLGSAACYGVPAEWAGGP